MARIASDHIGLRDAAEVFGVSVDTLRRRIRDNQLDEAMLVQGPFGATWVLPRASLAGIAAREQWDLEADARAVSHLADVARAETAVSREAAPPQTDAGQPDHDTIDLRSQEPADARGPTPSHRPVGLPVSAPTQPATVVLDPEVTRAISAELSSVLAENIEAELAAVREAITAAEVRAVAAEARSDALTTEQGRLQAQLKRSEADVEYWRAQHDRLDKELDRERNQRMAAETAKAVAEAEVREGTKRVAELSEDLARHRAREHELIGRETSTRAELDQALMAMGWWSRRRLARLQARSADRPRRVTGDD